MNQVSNKATDQLTVLVFKDNYSHRTFQVSLGWINRIGILLGIFLSLCITSFLLAFKYYRLNLINTALHEQNLNLLSYQTSLGAETNGGEKGDHLIRGKMASVGTFESSANPAYGTPSSSYLNLNHKGTDGIILEQSSKSSKENAKDSSHETGIYQFEGFPTVNVGIPPEPSLLPFIVQPPKITWKGQILSVHFALQYTKGDQENQQGRILLIARSSQALRGYPDGIFTSAGNKFLIYPEKGEFFSVSRFREVNASFSPIGNKEVLSSIEILIFDTEGKILVYQKLDPNEQQPNAKTPTDK